MNDINMKKCLTGDVSYNIEELLQKSKKNRLKAIAAEYDLRLSDSMTKLQMNAMLLVAMNNRLSIKLKQYSDEELNMLKNCVSAESLTENQADEVMAGRPFADGLIHIYAIGNAFVPAVPVDYVGKIMERCANRIPSSNDDNMTRCANAAAMIYGSFTPECLCDVFISYTGEECSPETTLEYLSSAHSDIFKFIDGKAICSLTEVVNISEKFDYLEYYIPTKKEIEAFAANGFDTTNYYYRQIISFLFSKCSITYQKANKLMDEIRLWCLTNSSLPELFKSIQAAEPDLSAEQFNFLLDMLGELYNQTPKWCYKGNSPQSTPEIKPLIMPRVRQTTVKTANVEPVRAIPTVGRNEPCPCGSGKKYKKCCGKSKSN